MSVHFKLRAEIYNRWNILYGYMLRLIQAIGGQFYMIQYKRCSEVNIDLVYEAFKDGFSDYIIKMDFAIILLRWKFQKVILYTVFWDQKVIC